jgi:hypothetical protein
MRSEFFLISFSTERRPGLTSREATYHACPKRFQPITMSPVAAMFGAVPRHAGAFVDQIFCVGTMAVSFSDLQLAFEFVSSGGMGENEAYLDRQSGKIYWHSEFGNNDEELPDDIDEKKYIIIPDKRELDLGKPLVLDFARQFLPDDYDEVSHIFSRRGAYRRYKDLLVRRGALERWYDFSNKAEEAALREWCAENGIDLSGT